MMLGVCEVRSNRCEPEMVITSNPSKRDGFDTGMAEAIVVAMEINSETIFRLMEA